MKQEKIVIINGSARKTSILTKQNKAKKIKLTENKKIKRLTKTTNKTKPKEKQKQNIKMKLIKT